MKTPEELREAVEKHFEQIGFPSRNAKLLYLLLRKTMDRSVHTISYKDFYRRPNRILKIDIPLEDSKFEIDENDVYAIMHFLEKDGFECILTPCYWSEENEEEDDDEDFGTDIISIIVEKEMPEDYPPDYFTLEIFV